MPLVRKQMLAYQRILNTAEDANDSQILLANGYDSAITMALQTEEEFIKNSGLELGRARIAYAKAQKSAQKAANSHQSIYDAIRGQFKDFAVSNQDPALVNDLREINGFAELFGSQNYCACQECRSVLSPAAYFVDLMRFIENHITSNVFASMPDHPLNLKSRRGDLWSLKLTCENTDTLVPYLTIVNEVLENYLAHIPPQTNVDPYQTLSDHLTKISFNLPFNLPLEELRIYLKHFGTSLHEVYKLLKQSEDRVWRAKLNLSIDELGVVTQEDLPNVKLRYGDKSSFTDFTVQDFMRYSGLSRDQLTDLLAIEYNDDLRSIKITKKPDPNGDELLNFLEVLTNLTPARLDFMHRFVRLVKRTPWTIKELDLLLTSLKEAGLISQDPTNKPVLNKEVAIHLAHLAEIQESLNLTVEELCPMFHLLPISSDFPLPSSKESDKKLFERLFDMKKLFQEPGGTVNSSPQFYHYSLNTVDPIATINTTPDPKTPVLLAGLGVSETELLLLLDLLKKEIPFAETGYCTLDLRAISLLYRHARLAKALKLKLEDFVQSLYLAFGQQDSVVRAMDQILTLREFREWLKSSPFNVSELRFIIKGEESNTVKFKSNLESVAAIVQEIQKLQQSKAAVNNSQLLESAARKIALELQDPEVTNKTDGLEDRLTKDNGLTSEQLSSVSQWIGVDISGPALQAALNTKFTEGIPDNPAELQPLIDLLTELEFAVPLFQSLSKFFNVSYSLLGDILQWTDKDKPEIKTALSATFADGAPDAPAELQPLIDLNREIERLLLLLSTNLKFKEEMISHITERPKAFDIDNLKSLSLDNVSSLSFYKKIVALGEDLEPSIFAALDDYLSSNIKSFSPDSITLLANLWKQNESLVKSLVKLPDLPEAPIKCVEYLMKCLKICSLLGIDAYSLQKLGNDKEYGDDLIAKEIALGAFTSKYDDEKIRNERLSPYQDIINVKKRDALCDYIIAREKFLKFKDMHDIYAFFLLDVEMGGCARTSRLVCAISSLQLYVHRCLMDLEQSQASDPDLNPNIPNVHVVPDESVKEQWDWRKNYRVWEANRKVFLWPENYCEPDLRDNKTPIFKELEDELLQEKITKEAADAAYKKYISQFAELAHLRIAGSYYYGGYQGGDYHTSYYFFGYTLQDPPQYYYRQWIDSKSWTPWEKIELTINSNRVSPIVHLGRLYLFWLDAKTTSQTKIIDGSEGPKSYGFDLNIVYSFLDEHRKWIPSQKIHLLSASDLSSDPKIDDIVYPFSFENGIYLNLTYTPGSYQLNLFTKKPTHLKEPYPDVLYGPPNKLLLAPSLKPDNKLALVSFKPDPYFSKAGLEFISNSKYIASLTGVYDVTDVTYYFDPIRVDPELHLVGYRPSDQILKFEDQQYLIRRLRGTPKRTSIRISTSLADELGEKLFNEGLESFISLRTQKDSVEHPHGIGIMNHDELQGPVDNPDHIDFLGAYGEYYRELYFHIPFLIAHHLNANQKFAEAKWWYERIFNPTAIEPSAEPPTDRNWQYIEFRGLGIQKMKDILTNEDALEKYETDPFNPHAVARLRLSAYQKTIVMKYIDNLLDWGDYLFSLDTMESINEATMLYVLASDILGKRPAKLGECDMVKDDRYLTYDQIAPEIDRKDEFLVTLENWNQVIQVESAIKRYEMAITQNAATGASMAAAFAVEAEAAMHGSTTSALPFSSSQSSFQKAMHKYGSETYRERAEEKTSEHAHVKEVEKPKRSTKRVTPSVCQVIESNPLVFCIPPNQDLLAYWDRVEDRLFKIRNCMNISGVRRQLALFQPPIDPMLFVRAKAAGLSLEDILATVQTSLPPYRFSYLIEKAKQFTQTVQSFGSQLLSALEKKDAEELLQLRSLHERNILHATKDIKTNQIKEAQDQLQALVETKTNVQNRIDHYQQLIDDKLTGWEITEQISKHTATTLKIVEGAILMNSAIIYLLPQVGSPFAMKYGGKETGDSMSAWAQWDASMAAVADAISASAGLEASFQRREEEWRHQLLLAQQEIKQVDQQILAAGVRVAIAEKDLEIHGTNVDQAEELDEFYKSKKFTNLGLYDYLSVTLNRLYREAYNIAHDMAKMAERTYQFERDDNTIFIASDNWQFDRAGLLAGERLLLQLQKIEKAYLEQNKRDYEVTQSFSLALLDPWELMMLRQTGKCDFKIPEVAFDLFYPGQYRRVIKSVRITIPCVAGPYANVSAKLTLKESNVRKKPSFNDEDIIDIPNQKLTSIATSNAQNDGGVFELNFRDERYLPFEGAGAINSTWGIELPSVVRLFDYDTISDVVMHISYTAKEDGAYREEVEANILAKLSDFANDPGLYRLISLKHEFPNALYQLLNPAAEQQTTEFDIQKKHFPFFLNDKELTLSPGTKIYLKPKGNEPAELGGPVLKINDQLAEGWADVSGGNLKEATLSLSGNPLGKWTIDVSSGSLDNEQIDDILILLRYTTG